MKKCNEVMTKNPICCVSNDLVEKVAGQMMSEHISSIPVIEDDQSKKLVGIVTDRDLTLRVLAESLDAKSTTVGSVMTHKVITCGAEDDLQKALVSMYRHKVRRIPIVDGDNNLVGVIARADMAAQRKSAEVHRKILQVNEN